MAEILVIAAHPDLQASRVSHALRQAIDKAGFPPQRLELRDLYRLYPDYAIDLVAEQQALSQASLIVWLHPLHWYGMPALMKLWVDEVLAHGWAYGEGQRALRGKRIWLVTSTGGSEASYAPRGYNGHALQEFLLPQAQIARLCGMQILKPQVVYGAHEINDEELHQQALSFVQRLLDYPDGCEAPEVDEVLSCWSLPGEMEGTGDGA
ncbi:NAD(P)H-dependent oxidoreductase [Pelomonas sp. SE-A7]|uniref:glutathione-regulated potassium-efflux system oxidoreductase KefF n=1 Tax=Pelomonas sp. SE-A7 TaxID=3054953 RepID=UPI00259D172F|nr:NAD(P)H-dependent oxidoreductase [Pelomonas sp. SE-A7]MDM4764548.1 NAD(P)H-dependent oxidoreductase [Pelomonas sp. SE-A7]